MTYRIGREVYAVVPMVVPKPTPRSDSNRAPNLAACCSTRYSTASARVAHLAQVPIDLSNHRLAAVPHLAGDGIRAHRRPLVYGLEPSRAVAVTEQLRSDLTGLPTGPDGHRVEQLSEIGQHRLLPCAVAGEKQP